MLTVTLAVKPSETCGLSVEPKNSLEGAVGLEVLGSEAQTPSVHLRGQRQSHGSCGYSFQQRITTGA